MLFKSTFSMAADDLTIIVYNLSKILNIFREYCTFSLFVNVFFHQTIFGIIARKAIVSVSL
jgi:hypothetical protein